MWKISHHKEVIVVEKKIAVCTCDICNKISESFEYTDPKSISTTSCIVCNKNLCKNCNTIIGDSQHSHDDGTSWWDDCLLDTCNECKDIVQKLWDISEEHTFYNYNNNDDDRYFYYNNEFSVRYSWIIDKLESTEYKDYIENYGD